MTIEFEYDTQQHRLSVRGDFTIYHAADIKKALLEHPGVSLDLAQVDSMDGAGLQLLLLAIREVQVKVCAINDSVADVLRLTGLESLTEAPQ